MASPSGAFEEAEDLYNHGPCGFHSLDQDGFFVRVNETELEWLGYTRDELIGKKKITDLLTSQSVATFQDRFPQFKLQGSLRDIELELVRKDGSILPVLVSATSVRDASGNFLMSRTVLYDITELRQAEQRFRELLEAAPDAGVVINSDGQIVMVNKEAQKMFGYLRDELLGKAIEILMPERFRASHGDHRAGYSAQPRVRPMGAGFELRGRRKDGSEFSVEISLGPLEDGKEGLVSCAVRDVTERNQLMNALRESEERFRVALQNSPVIVFNQDRELRYTWVNSTVLARAERDYLGYTDVEILGEEQGARVNAIKQGVIDTGIATRSEVVFHLENGTRYFDLTVEPLRDSGGIITGITCAATDITLLKEAAAERERLVEELKEALASVQLLSGLLPICASCKKIRDQHGNWQPIERYIGERSEAEFTHGMCPECLLKFGWM